MTKEEKIFYSDNNKCCGTCRWHCMNPIATAKITKPWVCGREDCSSFKKAKKHENGTRCKSWEVRNPYDWIYSCYYLVKCTSKPEAIWQDEGGHQGLHHLYFIASDVKKYYEKELDESIRFKDRVNKEVNSDDVKVNDEMIKSVKSMCARAFHITTKDVDICLKHCKEVEG